MRAYRQAPRARLRLSAYESKLALRRTEAAPRPVGFVLADEIERLAARQMGPERERLENHAGHLRTLSRKENL